MQLNEDQMHRQVVFCVTERILNNMRKKDLISEQDYFASRKIILDKYKPIVHLILD